jgi:hypothetical protein
MDIEVYGEGADLKVHGLLLEPLISSVARNTLRNPLYGFLKQTLPYILHVLRFLCTEMSK